MCWFITNFLRWICPNMLKQCLHFSDPKLRYWSQRRTQESMTWELAIDFDLHPQGHTLITIATQRGLQMKRQWENGLNFLQVNGHTYGRWSLQLQLWHWFIKIWLSHLIVFIFETCWPNIPCSTYCYKTMKHQNKS
jgi:hypothetical protein